MAIALERQYYQYSGIFKVRWLASEFNAIYKIYKSYDLLATDLESISADDTYDEVTRQQALRIFNKLNNKNLLAYLHFHLDILNYLSFLSTLLQATLGSVIGKKHIIENVLSTIEKRTEGFVENYGKFEIDFYSECECIGDVRTSKCKTASAFDKVGQVRYKLKLLKSSERDPK